MKIFAGLLTLSAALSLGACAQLGDTGTQLDMQFSTATGQILGIIAGRALGR